MNLVIRKAGSALKRCGGSLHGLAERIYSAPLSVRDANMKVWYATPGAEQGLRYEFDARPDDVVLDVGGFEGDWAAEMSARYGCRIHICEPVPEFAERLRRRFSRNSRLTIHTVGLGPRDEKLNIFVMSESSSVHRKAADYHPTSVQEPIHVRNVIEFLDELAIHKIAVMKINIEGGEYELLESLLDNDRIATIDNLLVQFHDFVPNAQDRMNSIRQRLKATHEQTFAYDFVWEGWKRV